MCARAAGAAGAAPATRTSTTALEEATARRILGVRVLGFRV